MTEKFIIGTKQPYLGCWKNKVSVINFVPKTGVYKNYTPIIV
jgi:hypothetical protein